MNRRRHRAPGRPTGSFRGHTFVVPGAREIPARMWTWAKSPEFLLTFIFAAYVLAILGVGPHVAP